MTLYKLTEEQLYLYQLLSSGEAVDLETGQIDPVISERLEINGENLNDKIKGCGIMYKQLLSDIDAIKAEETRLANRRRSIEKGVNRIKNNLDNTLKRLELPVFNTPQVSITFRSSTKTEILDERLIPEEFINEKITRTPMKDEIKKAIKDGMEVPGAVLIECQNIQIK